MQTEPKKTPLGDRVRFARKQAGLTQKGLADKVGISQTAIYKLERGGSKSSRRTVAIALECGVDPIWLHNGKGEMFVVGTTTETTGESKPYRAPIFARIPLVSWEAASRLCAESATAFQPKAVESWIPVAPRSSEQTFALRVPDDSMEPEFREGEILIVDPLLPGKHNQFLIARMNGDSVATFKQLIIAGNRSYLKPLNTRYPLIDMTTPIQVCGVVVGKYKEY
ncbi:MAG: helix-turn-helix domain-containing protein [Magnetococcales bacterium]|nr:helix-turn-helix domain-containing protein [Magnetococcales bacterium]